MKHFLLSLTLAGLTATVASAGSINYSTAGSTLTCPVALAGCINALNGLGFTVTNGTGTLTVTYVTASSSNPVTTPSSISLGAIDISTTGAFSGQTISGATLTILITSTPPGTSGTLPNGGIGGTISVNVPAGTSASTAGITFQPSNTVAPGGLVGITQGNLYPGLNLTSGLTSITYLVSQPSLSLVAPQTGGGSGFGETSIQGAVFDTSAPEPTTFVLMGAGLGLVGLLRRRASR